MYPQLQDDSAQLQQEETSPYCYQIESTLPGQQISIGSQPFNENEEVQYDAKPILPKYAKFIQVGSILLVIGTFFITLFLLADIICGAQYYEFYSDINHIISPHNSIAESVAKTLLMLINLSLMIASGVLGIVSVRNPDKVHYSLIHVVCLSIGMVVFLSEIITVNISFFTTGTDSSTGPAFFPILIIFTVFSICGLVCCCACCVSGFTRYRNISRTTSI